MDPRYTITTARLQDLPALPAIERAAGRLFQGLVPESVMDDTTCLEDLREVYAAGRLWVARCDDHPVGFALVEMLSSDLPHLEEIDVDPQHGRRGIGAALVRTVCEWASRSGYAEVTLTTFRDVAWNMPFYSRLGFEEIPSHELRPELVAVVADETVRGLDPERRVVMSYRIPAA